jgi:hypothetical protein
MEILALIPCLFFAFYLQANQKKLPLHPDTGLFAYRGVMENEGITLEPKLHLGPDQKYFCAEGYFPTQSKDVIYHLFRLWRKYVPGDIKNYRYYYGFYNLITVVVLYITTSYYFNSAVGLTAAWIYTIYSACPFTDAAQLHAENYGNLVVLAALLFLYLGLQRQSWPLFFLAGVSLGFLIISFKITYIFEAMALGVPLGLQSHGYGPLAVYSLGAISFIGMMLAYYYYRGWWPFFLAWISPRRLWHYRDLPARNYGDDPGSRIVNLLNKKYLVFAAQTGFLWFGTLACLYYYGNELFSNNNLFIVCIMIGSLMNVVMQNKYYLSHFFALLPVLSILSALGLILVIDNLIIYNNMVMLLLGIVFFLMSLQQLSGFLFTYNPLEYFIRFYQLLKHDHILSFLAAETVASYIYQHTTARDTILMLGYNAEFYPLARRRAALGRLEFPLCNDPVINDRYFGPEWQAWVADAVRRDRPKYIADLDGSLDIQGLSAASGWSYRLEKLFYGLFPVYTLILAATEANPGPGRASPGPAKIINPEADLKQKQLRLARWFLEQPFRKGCQYYPETLKSLCRDWCRLNKVAAAW